MRPDFVSHSAWGDAFRKGVWAARQSLLPMLALQGAMALVVFIYYCWSPGSAPLSQYAAWQHAGGILAAALITGLAGGVISEVSLVYIGDKGRWTAKHVEDMAFKFALFFFNGAVVYAFYALQTRLFGEGTSWSILVPKILVDQFLFTVFWATPYQTLLLRWQALRFSGERLWRELDRNFIREKMLPIMVTNWMFWLPGVTLIYSMPSPLQSPLFSFAIAIWGLLLPAVSRQGRSDVEAPVSTGPSILPQAAE